MQFARLLRFTLFAFLLPFACLAVTGQSASSNQSKPAQAQSSSSQPSSDQAYSLPPDKLAKAKTLNKIRLTLEIAASLWGLAVIWLLLSTRTAVGLDAWAAAGFRACSFSLLFL
jgi:STE24 endopeptidase